MKKKIKLSILIVYYNGIKSFQILIGSIYSNKVNLNFEVIVVDNSKNTKKLSLLGKYVSKIKYIKSPKNLGYGGGNNLGAKYAKGKYILILNPDTKLKKNSVNQLVQFLDKNNECAIVAPNLIHEDGSLFEKMGSRELTPIEGISAISFVNHFFPHNFISNRYYLKDMDFNRLREVNAVPGSAFMIRKNIFEKIGGFDEKLFMYFEENDIGKRIKKAGYKIFIQPKSEIIHYWDSKKKKNIKLQNIFNKSRFYYFKKHYGFFSAIIVEFINRISKWDILFFAIFLLASYLRFYDIGKYLNFSGDNAWYYLSARDMILEKKIPLLGIPSSVPILKQGAVWTWILALILKIFNFNPLAGGYLSAIFGLIPIIFIYLLVKMLFNNKVAIISVIITSFSSYLLINDRMPYVTTPIFIFTLILYLFILLALRRNNWAYFGTGMVLSILYQFELAAAFLFFPVLVIFIFYRNKINIISVMPFIFGVLIGLLPFIISDLNNGLFIQTIGFVGWLITKILEGILSIFKFENYIYYGEIITYLKQFIFPYSSFISILVLVILFINFVKELFIKKLFRLDKYYLILVWSFFGILAFSLRGSFSVAYFPILFFPIIILLSISLNWLFKKHGFLLYIFIIIFTLTNILYFKNFNKKMLESGELNYPKQVEISDFIINYVNGKKYSLDYSSSKVQFESSIDNFRYLLWYKGNGPIKNSNLKLVLADGNLKMIRGELVKDFGVIKIYKQ